MRTGLGRLSVSAAAAVTIGALAVPAAPAAADRSHPRRSAHTVTAGPARFQVLTPTLIRLEYAADGRFEDGPTFNVLDRALPTPRFDAKVHGGVLTITTAKLTLTYREGSGPFTPANTSISLAAGGRRVTARPSWPPAPGSCRFDTACQAEDGRLNAGESVNYDHSGYTGRGFAADYGQVSATDSWTITGVPADGDYALQLRYANGAGVDRTTTVAVNGAPAGTAHFPATPNWDTWAVTSLPVHLHRGTNTVSTTCAAGDGCNVNLDSAAVTASGAGYPTTSTTPAPPADEPGQLGGWTRGLDAYPNQAGTDISAEQLHPGILNRQGWALLDDTYTALRTPQGWVEPRPAHTGSYQDGYFFGYGRDYQRALRDLRAITGPATMLPKWATGVWFSEYNAFTTSDYENQLVPAFRRNNVPLDSLVVDTDWKSPQQWDGWNWNPNLFPDPQAFLRWAQQQHLKVTLNVHAGIDGSDPKFPQAQQTAQGKLQRAAQCFSPTCYRFDWSDRDQAKAWFDLHHPFEQQGVRQWWLDWCCTDSYVGLQGLTPDSWINELYARDIDAEGLRGFNLARIGASFEDYRGAPASGPWGEHRSTVHFTGDTDPTWDTLAFEAHVSPDEASIGLPYVSEDIGSFKGKHLPDDLYARWVQLGAFQPILRLHSDHGDRLPWQYGAGQQPAADALRLREALVPYTYALAWQANRTGLPITRPLYLDYPSLDAAYRNPGEYLYGPDVLVAPVTTPGSIASQRVWFPPGRWTDYFTGATYTGPSTATLQVPLDRMPVFVKAGGIVPEQPGREHVDADGNAPLDLKVYAGGSGRFTAYDDAGDGLGYQHGQYTETPLTYTAGRDAASTVTIGAGRGRYRGEPARRGYTIDLVDVSAPHSVRLDHRPLSRISPNGSGPGWWYDAATATLHVRTAGLSTAQEHTISQSGGRAVSRPASAAVALSIDPSTPTTLAPGASTTVATTVHNGGPAAITGARVRLDAPAGWTVAPASAAVGTVAAGGSATQSWTVTGPSGGQSSTASLKAVVDYTDANTRAPGSVTTYQGPPSNLPPVISSLDPTSAAAGQQVTIHGTNFGATQADPRKDYVFFTDGDISWGAPFDGAAFHVDSWSDTAITFTVPEPSGPGGVWHVTPGDTADVSVTTDAGGSNTVTLRITG
jgi:Glycosyl hydrolases family 31/Domain of unknown function (DUF5110)/NPCBM-associated, NEW3 domain of alpha-galactosidase/IPT/TIG domain